MSLFFCSLNSGSNGNSYLIGNHHDNILIDGGLSCKETEKRLKEVDLSIKSIKGIFISHEHIDHIKGVEMIVMKHGIPIYITEKTYGNSKLKLPSDKVKFISLQQTIKIGSLAIKPFPKSHDAIDPCSFIIKNDSYCIGVLTDIGICCNHVIEAFKSCNAVFLEANYDQKMLDNGSYPFHLKRRISGDNGHLSNDQALELFINHRNKKLKYLLLSHLSQENNHPDLVLELFKSNSTNTEIHIASRHKPTPLFVLGDDKKAIASKQLHLF
jgi:phosphoribosyl 1,2-cyclic phosphodiesterase